MIQIINQIAKYSNSLDWAYIITFILLAYAINQIKVLCWIAQITKIKIATRYRILITGLLYGILVYFIRGYTLQKIECLLQSFVFAMVFHKLLIEKIIQQVLPKNQNNQ